MIVHLDLVDLENLIGSSYHRAVLSKFHLRLLYDFFCSRERKSKRCTQQKKNRGCVREIFTPKERKKEEMMQTQRDMPTLVSSALAL